MKPASLKGLLLFAAVVAAKKCVYRNSTGAIENMKAHIKAVVLLVMENRSFDNILGGQTLEGLDNAIYNGPFCNPYNLTDPSLGTVCSVAKDYDSIIDDPDHAVYGNNIEFYGTFNPDNEDILSGKLVAHQQGFVHEQLRLYDSSENWTLLSQQVMNYYTEEQVPVLTSLVQNFVTFNYWHSAIPGVSFSGPQVLYPTGSTLMIGSPRTPTAWRLWPAAPSGMASTTTPSPRRASM